MTNIAQDVVSAKTPAPKKSKKKIITYSPEEIESLESLNKKVCVVKNIGKVVEFSDDRSEEPNPLTFKAFQFEMYANYCPSIPDIATKWVKWEGRRTVKAIVYKPGEEQFCGENGNLLNTWRPSKLIPIKGDVSYFLKYIDHLFALDSTYKEWFIRWLAYPFQHPGTKLHTAVVCWSLMTGTGKSTIGYILEVLYGEHNFKEIEESDLTEKYNHWAVFRELIMGDEIRGDNARAMSNKMKTMITRKKMTVNLKYRAQFDYDDCLNFYFTSNHSDAFFVTPQDRRLFVHHANEEKVMKLFPNKVFNEWLKNGGYNAILHYLKYEVDLSTPVAGGMPDSTTPAPFDPRMDAPRSSARQEMIEAGRDELDVWIDELASSPDDTFDNTPGWKLATAEDLFGRFTLAFPRSRTTYKTFTSTLKNSIPMVRGGNKVRVSEMQPAKRIYCTPAGYAGYDGASEVSLISAYSVGRE